MLRSRQRGDTVVDIRLGTIYATPHGRLEVRVICPTDRRDGADTPPFAVQSRPPGGADWGHLLAVSSLEEAGAHVAYLMHEQQPQS